MGLASVYSREGKVEEALRALDPLRSEIVGKAAATLVKGLAGRAVAQSRHAFPAALRQDWLFRSALLVDL